MNNVILYKSNNNSNLLIAILIDYDSNWIWHKLNKLNLDVQKDNSTVSQLNGKPTQQYLINDELYIFFP